MANDAQTYWRSFEPQAPLTSLSEALTYVESVAKEGLRLVWRGVKDQAWGLLSSLYRYASRGGLTPSDKDYADLEQRVVRRARESD